MCLWWRGSTCIQAHIFCRRFLLVTRSGHHHEEFKCFSRYEEIQNRGHKIGSLKISIWSPVLPGLFPKHEYFISALHLKLLSGSVEMSSCSSTWFIPCRGRRQKNIYFCFTDYAKAFYFCGSPQTVESSERDGNTRLPDLPLEKPVCRSGSNS